MSAQLRDRQESLEKANEELASLNKTYLDLLLIAANNLVGNAVKYGLDKGRIVLSSEDRGQKIRITVYNDSRPISEEDKANL